MDIETMKKANALANKIEKLNSVQKRALTENAGIGITIEKAIYGVYYIDLRFDEQLNNKLLSIIRHHVGEQLPILQEQLNKL